MCSCSVVRWWCSWPGRCCSCLLSSASIDAPLRRILRNPPAGLIRTAIPLIDDPPRRDAGWAPRVSLEEPSFLMEETPPTPRRALRSERPPAGAAMSRPRPADGSLGFRCVQTDPVPGGVAEETKPSETGDISLFLNGPSAQSLGLGQCRRDIVRLDVDDDVAGFEHFPVDWAQATAWAGRPLIGDVVHPGNVFCLPAEQIGEELGRGLQVGGGELDVDDRMVGHGWAPLARKGDVTRIAHMFYFVNASQRHNASRRRKHALSAPSRRRQRGDEKAVPPNSGYTVA